MDTQSHVEVLRLHGEHLRTLLDQVIRELTTIGQNLATNGNSSSALVAPHLSGLEQQSKHLVVETHRFQEFVHALAPHSLDTAEADGESDQSPPPLANTPRMDRCKIVCTLDGKEPAVI